MVTLSQITEFGERIGQSFPVERVILFGSYAQSKATEDSDVDLFVVMPFEGRSVNQSVKMRLQLRPAFPVDILVRTPEMVRDRLAMGDPFMQQILEEGKILYETDNSRMD